MWPFTSNKRLADYLVREDIVKASNSWPFSKKSFAKFLCRFTDADAERVIKAYCEQEGHCKIDPIEDAPEYASTFADLQLTIAAEFPEQKRGQCHLIWDRQKKLLAEKGISWLSPSELNPHICFD